MAGDFDRLLSMQTLASQFGSGLKPELHALLSGKSVEETETVRRLDARVKSSGPAHHNLSQEELCERGIPQIGGGTNDLHQKDGTDG